MDNSIRKYQEQTPGAENLEQLEAYLEEFLLPQRLKRLDTVLSQRTNSLTVVLERIRNYHNVSAVIRSADAFGLTTVHLIGEQFEYSPAISLGTERWVQLVKHPSAEEAVSVLKNLGYAFVVLQPEAKSTPGSEARVIPVTELPFEEQLALVFGNEKDGVSEQISVNADMHAYIPMKGFVESLNISVACAICLFCSTIMPTSPARRTASLLAEDQQKLRARWLKESVKHSEALLRRLGKEN